ncbi:Uncharacterised protein [Shigella sonnei]|nr:Uncharacterised protein [Shigella sonnei]
MQRHVHSECVLTSDRVFFNETIVSMAQLSAQRLIVVGTEPGWILTLWLSGMFTPATFCCSAFVFLGDQE